MNVTSFNLIAVIGGQKTDLGYRVIKDKTTIESYIEKQHQSPNISYYAENICKHNGYAGDVEWLRQLCTTHDVTYAMSDDSRAYKRGMKEYDTILELAEKVKREDFVKIWNRYAAAKAGTCQKDYEISL